ncbi:hypothetical protein PFISCL1PPCAC_25236 [Pristionchus fissidentatus]|uniref:Uncharacterized protein n=1 Tax=Pristionchus fissidentatus TaxID=1538716 RepID=A0AAV5WWE5_9BILA|nr:hypothetical protein PFISCL1PPCAC_25236 [Pristionchus fissidentatus]
MAPKDVISSIRNALPEELGGKKEKDSVVQQILSFIDSIEKKPPPMQMGLGGGAGLCTGYIFTKGSKATALVLGIGLITFQFCNYRGYIKLNRSKIEKDLKDLKGSIERELYGKSQFEMDKNKIGSFVSSHAYLLGGFAAGSLLGYAIA